MCICYIVIYVNQPRNLKRNYLSFEFDRLACFMHDALDIKVKQAQIQTLHKNSITFN